MESRLSGAIQFLADRNRKWYRQHPSGEKNPLVAVMSYLQQEAE